MCVWWGPFLYVRTYVCTCVHTCAQVWVGVGGCALVRMSLVVGAGVAVGGCGSGVCAWVWVRMRVCVGGWVSGAWVGAGVVGCGWVWIGVGVSAHMSVAVHGSSCVHILLVALVRYIPRFLLRLGATMPSQFGPRASLVHCGGSGWCTMCHNAYSSSAFYFNLDCDVFIVLFFIPITAYVRRTTSMACSRTHSPATTVSLRRARLYATSVGRASHVRT